MLISLFVVVAFFLSSVFVVYSTCCDMHWSEWAVQRTLAALFYYRRHHLTLN